MKIYKIAQMTMKDIYKDIDEDMKVEDEDENGKELKKRWRRDENGLPIEDDNDTDTDIGIDMGESLDDKRYNDWNIRDQDRRTKRLEDLDRARGGFSWENDIGLTRPQFDQMMNRKRKKMEEVENFEEDNNRLSPIKWRVELDEDKPQKPRYNSPTNISPTSSMGIIEQRMKDEQESRRKQYEETSARKLAEWRMSLQTS